MLKKYKKIYSLAHQAGYRNYTVRDLLELKGKKKLTQINVVSANEAAAAEIAGIDLLITGADNLKAIREAAPNTFLTCGIKYTEHESKESIAKKCFEDATVILPTCKHLDIELKKKYPNKESEIFYQGITPSEWIKEEVMELNLENPIFVRIATYSYRNKYIYKWYWDEIVKNLRQRYIRFKIILLIHMF